MSRSAVRDAAVRNGYRSGLEQQIGTQLERRNINAMYEPCRFCYVKPETPATYTPDFILPNGIVVESKGRFLTEDRKKHKLIKAQHPELDIRFVFSNSRAKIGKKSKTTYAMWCEQHGFDYADRFIPDEWLTEPPNRASLGTIKRISKR